MADPLSLPRIVLVTGTSTEVGKTVATAALAAVILARGSRVAVVKPAQTGVQPGEPGDIQHVCRLLGAGPDGTGDRLTTHELVRLAEPLAPQTAARRAGVQIPLVAQHAKAIEAISETADVTLVEGAGGLLVGLDARGGTLADLGTGLRYKGISTGAILVAAAGLGTLNHVALTAEALASRGIPLIGVVVGSWPDEPGLAEQANLQDLPGAAKARLLGRIPAGVGALDPQEFAAQAPDWLDDL